jgi:tetratricopeptide (TPR) repeat protein
MRREKALKGTHLSIETLARLLAGDLDHEELLGQVLPHFLARCPACQSKFQEIQQLQKEFGHWDERVVVFEGSQAPELFHRLAALPFDEQLSLIADDPSFQTWALCQFLLRQSVEARFDNPGAAVNFAELAVNIALNLGDAYDPNWVLDLRARAYAYLGSARRVLGEFRSSETAFRRAEALALRSMTGNSLVWAEILDLKSSLRREQRRVSEAIELLDQAVSVYRENHESHGLAAALVKKAKILEESGDLSGAIDLLQGASRKIDPLRDSRLSIYARHNLIWCLATADRHQEAAQLLPEVREIFRQFAKPLDHIRLSWLEGRISLGLGDVEAAESHFRQVQQEFLRRGMAYDAALVSLDLAVVYAQEGRHEELKQLALEVIPIFEAQDVHREALAAMLMFQNACKEERLTAELARHIASLLERSRQAKGRAQTPAP